MRSSFASLPPLLAVSLFMVMGLSTGCPSAPPDDTDLDAAVKNVAIDLGLIDNQGRKIPEPPPTFDQIAGKPPGFADGVDNDTVNTAGAGLTLNGSQFSVADGGIGAAQLADNGVNSDKIADGSIGSADLSDAAVTTPKLADGAVTSSKLADNSVSSTTIADGTVGTTDIANSAVTTAKIADGSVTLAKLSGIDNHSLNAADSSPIDALFVDNNGNVGIGTTAPVGKFDVRSGNGSFWQIDTVNGDLFCNGGSDGLAGIFNTSTLPNALLGISVGAGNVTVRASGNVGVGTGNPIRRLHVVDPSIFAGRFETSHPLASVLELHNSAAAATWEWGVTGTEPPGGFGGPGFMYLYKQGEIDVAMTIAPNAWIGMGIRDPQFRLELPNIASADGRGRANAWVTYSSLRWKENVQTLDGALDTIKRLRGVSFDWKPEHGGQHDIGFVAEEVGQVVPELVTWEPDSPWAQGVAYDRVTAIAVEAIKEQQRQIEALQQSNVELRAQLDRLTQLIETQRADAGSPVK